MIDKPLGYIIGESTPFRAYFIAERPPKIGEYVVVRFEDRDVLGLVENCLSGNPIVPSNVTSISHAEHALRFNTSSKTYLKGSIRFLSYIEPLLEKGILVTPKTPPRPLSPVFEADENVLAEIFSMKKIGRSKIRVGTLVSNPKVPVYVNVNSIVSRHLAILAVTGAGKSNTVSIITQKIVEELNGTVLIFDMHSEYSFSKISSKQEVLPPKLNPLALTKAELLQLMRVQPNASNQERVFRTAYDSVYEEFIQGKIQPTEFFDKLKEEIDTIMRRGKDTGTRNAAAALLNKIDDVVERYSDIFDFYLAKELSDMVKPGRLNIFDLGEVDEEGADVIVSHYLRRLLSERKQWYRTRSAKGYPVPILCVLEEAHVLIPREEDTLTKYWASRVAREGRKFGVGLVLVSQRPKAVDENTLSQMNNKIILKLIEPSDQRYVQAASEQLSDELLELLPSLDVGEAILIGEMTILPALVKIDKHPGKKMGSDIQVTDEWSKYLEEQEKRKELARKILEDMEG